MFKVLVRTSETCYEQVKLFDTFYSMLVEDVGTTTKTITEYNTIGSNAEECLEKFIHEGFVEVTNV